MSALSKMLGLDDAMKSIDFEAVGKSFIEGAERQAKMEADIALILQAVRRIETHLGLSASPQGVADVVDLKQGE